MQVYCHDIQQMTLQVRQIRQRQLVQVQMHRLRAQVVSKLLNFNEIISLSEYKQCNKKIDFSGSAATTGATTSTSGQNASGGNGETASGSAPTTTAAVDPSANAATNSTSQTTASLG